MSNQKKTETLILKVEISLDEERQAVKKEKDYNRINSVALAIQDFSYSATHIKDIKQGEVFWAGRGVEAGKGEPIVAWSQSNHAVDEALDSFGWIEVDPCKLVVDCEKHYCPNCTEWNESEDELIPKENKS